jgi:murein DD-endopeptidase MepM/ murein hydrolase activator NlpD
MSRILLAITLLAVSIHCSATCGLANAWLKQGPAAPVSSADSVTFSCMSPPTNPTQTRLRKPSGRFHQPRDGGGLHTGVDLILQQEALECLGSTAKFPPEAFHVYAVAPGRVAYARFNSGCVQGTKGCDYFEKGLGLTVIIEHDAGIYSLYAHLAQNTKQNACYPAAIKDAGQTMLVKVGQTVEAGQLIGYLGQLTSLTKPDADKYDGPTGNALRTQQPVQLHFELFKAAAGASTKEAFQISEIVPKAQRGQIDPTVFIKQLGVKGYGD